MAHTRQRTNRSKGTAGREKRRGRVPGCSGLRARAREQEATLGAGVGFPGSLLRSDGSSQAFKC